MTAIFLILAALTITGTAAAMSLRNSIHCVLSATLAFLGLASLYLLLGAQFVGFTQVLVYVGAVAILAVFAIMMTQSSRTQDEQSRSSSWISGGLVSVAVFAVLGWAVILNPISRQVLPAQPTVSVSEIGDALLHVFALPLEIIGLLLTAALIGAVVVAMPERQEKR